MNRNGMHTFLLIWSGQVCSKIGTGITRFALLIWVYQQTDQAMSLALLSFFSFVPLVLVSPLAGVWIDRLDRRRVMWLADVGAGLATLLLLLLLTTDQLAVWHLYLAQFLAGVFEAFQGPAFTAVSTQLLPPEQYARASGLRSVVGGSAAVATPFLAGLLLPFVGLSGIMLFDLATLIVAVVTLLLAVVPPLAEATADDAQAGFWPEMRQGFTYIWQRPGLRGMLGLYTAFTFLDALTWFSILPVMILARSGGDEMAMAAVEGAIGGAIVFGGLVISVWGGPRRKIHGYLAGNVFAFFIGGVAVALGSTVTVWVIGVWLAAMLVPLISSSSETIWQERVPAALQGRVFAVHQMARQAMTPLGILLGGLLADHWFEPAMQAGGAFAALFAPLVGSGPGSGIAVMFLGTAVLGVVIGFIGYQMPAVYGIEEDKRIITHPIKRSQVKAT